MNKSYGLVVKEVNRMVTSSVWVLKELSIDELDRLGGEKALIERTKINIVDSLSWSGLPDWSVKIRSIDIEQVKGIDDFIDNLSRVLEIEIVSFV